MENAVKALEIAGAVLISLLVLGLAVFAYNNISETKRIEQAAIAGQQAADTNKDFEAYNRDGVYGTELISLINKVVDYNNIVERKNEGYEKITLSVNVGSGYFYGDYTDATATTDGSLYSKYNELSNEIIDDGKETITEFEQTKTVAQWSKSGNHIINEMSASHKDIINTYKDNIIEQTDFSRKTFNCTDVEYNNVNGRITRMVFIEE